MLAHLAIRLALVLVAADPAPLQFEVTFARSVLDQPFTGRVFVVVAKQPITGVHRQSWFKPEPFFAQDVRDLAPGTPLRFQPTAWLPHPLGKLPAGKYHVQAILDRDLGGQNALTAPGNLYSKPLTLDLDPAASGLIRLTVDQQVAPRKFEEKENVKLVDIPSELLSAFHGKPMRLRAGVVLPKSFASDPVRRYPVVYEIPGFGGDRLGALGAAARNATDVAGSEMIWVVLDPSCRLGHHVFADSENNGPCGQALVSELIPFIEKTYRGLGVPGGRLVTGHSSGGWSSLWLQVAYPDFFGGVWSTAPDPVDFRDFQMVDIYQPNNNLFFDAKKQPRPLARRGGKVALHYQPFSDMEVVFGRGGQLFSFEAVFSPRGPDGRPRPLWDRSTGAIDPVTALAWKKYDIRLILENNWSDPRSGTRESSETQASLASAPGTLASSATRRARSLQSRQVHPRRQTETGGHLRRFLRHGLLRFLKGLIGGAGDQVLEQLFVGQTVGTDGA